jgi:type IV pilus assembly protein PilM
VTPLVGVDIAPASVSIIELQASAQGPRISHHAQQALADGAWQSALDGEPQTLIDAVRRTWKASGSRLRSAALALPAGAVITRTLCLPQPAHDDELEWLVEAEAAQTLPFPREEISLDFANLGPAANEDGMIDVLLVAARSERIAQRVAWAEAAGLKPVVVGVESQAVVAAIDRLCGDRRHAESILHFSREGTLCLFVRGDRVLFERELGKPLPTQTAKADDWYASEVEAWLDAASLEWQRHGQLFAASAADGDIDRIHLAGAGALGPRLADGLRRRLGIDVSVPEPFLHWPGVQSGASGGGGIGDLERGRDPGGSSCLLACGLALHGLCP